MNDKLLEQVPRSARRILDVGCGLGEFGAALKERQECTVTGIEIDNEIAQQAINNVDQVIVGDVARVAPLLPRGYYDAIVCGDVIEHLVDPQPVIEELAECVAFDGVMLFSVPNVQHWSVIEMLLFNEDWVYQPGLISPGHMRFYTRKSFRWLLVEEAGLDATMVSTIDVPIPDSIGLKLQAMNLDLANFSIYQMIFAAAPINPPLKVSIIIPVHNLWKQTRHCIKSIDTCTAVPYEIIVIDNASTDKTWDKLTEMSAKRDNLIIRRNRENESYATACNQGIVLASGDYVVVLNNDTLVTEGWLGKMIAAAQREGAGIVGPMSDYVSGVQHVDFVYKDHDQLTEFARRVQFTQMGSAIETQAVVGFCMLISRSVIERIGVFDEQFVNGYEETDFCLRARDAGFRVIIAGDTFIHHTGSQTFIEVGGDDASTAYWDNIEENHQRFVDKWPGRIPDHIGAENGSGWFFRPEVKPLPIYSLPT